VKANKLKTSLKTEKLHINELQLNKANVINLKSNQIYLMKYDKKALMSLRVLMIIIATSLAITLFILAVIKILNVLK